MARRRKGWLKRRFKVDLKKDTLFSVIYLSLFGLAFLISLSFTGQGTFLARLNIRLMDLFGWGTFFIVFLLIQLALLFTRLTLPWSQATVFMGSVLLALGLISVTKAGFIGKQVYFQIAGLITPLGTTVILILSSLVGLLVVFNTSFDQVLKMLGKLLSLFKGLFKHKPSLKPGLLANRPAVREITVKEPPRTTTNAKPTDSLPQTINIPGAQDKVWTFPPLSLLEDSSGKKADRGDVKKNADIIEQTLDSFGISTEVKEINPGPAVTQYAIELALGTKLSKVLTLSNNLALALAAPGGQIRIEAPIPGRSLVGIEIPNHSPEIVNLKHILNSDVMKGAKSKLAVPLGLDVSGNPRIADIGKMPHILIAGQTGSGKSVLLNAWISSLMFRTTPTELKMILVDPKRVEFTKYQNLPHLHVPVITEPKEVVRALNWAASHMDDRYKIFNKVGVRNLEAYNEQAGFQAMPYLVIIIDELADIIMQAPAEVEDSICRIAQMARATGIHLVIATQRPSVDVLTGLIKANIPARLSFAVSSMVDSRVIIDSPGAEKLLGKGDMLYIPPDQAKPSRIQGAYLSDGEIDKLTNFLKSTGIGPNYDDTVKNTQVTIGGSRGGGGAASERDELLEQAIDVIITNNQASASFLQRKLSVGYSRAAKILDQLQEVGIVGAPDRQKTRELMVSDINDALARLSGPTPE